MNFHHSQFWPTLLTAVVVLTSAGCAATQPKRELGTYSLMGSGKPILVFQAGLGDDRRTWQDIPTALAAHYTVFAHDRPGTGNNPPVDGPRSPCTVAAEQRAALRSAGLTPPYVLVGHSLGGLYQYVYASLYPQEVAGFVLIDPTHPRNWAEIQRQLPVTATLFKGIKAVAFGDMQRREFDDQIRCLDRPEFARPLAMPGRVLIAGRPRASDPEGYEALHLSLAREWPALTGVAGVEMVWDAAHYIHHERPERTIAAIRQTASPRACADGCWTSQRHLTGVDIGGHPAFDIAFGITRRNQIEAVLGQPRKTYAVHDAQGSDVRVYHRKPDNAHAAVSFIPILGDIVDAVKGVQALQEWRELIVEYDAVGVVKRAGLRRAE